MRAVKVCVVLALMILAGYAQVSSFDSEKARVLSLENAWNEAEKHKDGKAIEGLLAPTFAYTDSDGTFMNKQQYLASITEAGYRPDQIVNDAMNVQAYEHAVVVTGTYREKGTEKGKTYSRRGRFTDMWVQEKGGWLCAASHETLIGR
jgi:ketosteroid isomerase-like protein